MHSNAHTREVFRILGVGTAIITNKLFSQIQHLVGVRRGKEKNKAVARDRECSAEPSRCARATLTRSSRRSISGCCSKESVFSLSKKLRAHGSHPSNPPCIYQTRHASEQMTNPVQVCSWQGVGVACLRRARGPQVCLAGGCEVHRFLNAVSWDPLRVYIIFDETF